MIKVYLFYISRKYITKDISFSVYHPYNSKRKIILYGWTTNKEYKNAFQEFRINKFKCEIQEMDTTEFEKFSKEFSDFEIKEYVYKNYGYSVNIISTLNENKYCRYSWSSIIEDNKRFKLLDPEIINCLKRKYRNALMTLGYQTFIYSINDDLVPYYNGLIEMDDEMVLHVRDASMKIGKDQYISLSLSLKGKEFNIFLHVFKCLLK